MTIKLFYSPGACSLAPHIALEEAGVPFEPVRVDFSKTQQRSPDYLRINPKGRVPALADGDFIVTENPAVLRYIATLAPEKKLWPDNARDEARCMEWMAWISSGVHVSYAHIRRAERYATGEEAIANVQAKGRETTRDVWQAVEAKLPAEGWSSGDRYSVADAYLYVFWAWGGGQVLGYDMTKDFPKWSALAKRVADRPATQRALEREKAVMQAA
ncbi:glutathione S-transferase family protein [Terrarubrum flagellatum]|uniref:glutathione S-transferase family protein n=1 Tax=Terrirubrum flagellatum TaxID=2895980 RepID=UPI003144FA18